MAASKQTFIIHLTIMNCAAMNTDSEAFVENLASQGWTDSSFQRPLRCTSVVKISSMTMTVTRTKKMNINFSPACRGSFVKLKLDPSQFLDELDWQIKSG